MDFTDQVYTIGVVADTHVPDRLVSLHPGLIPALKTAKVDRILHAGDICTVKVLEELESAAPVIAVRGNRDWALSHLPWEQEFTLAGISIALMHGHGGWVQYFLDKLRYLRGDRYSLERYIPILYKAHKMARVVVFGHTHYPECRWIKDRLIFNPGSAGIGAGSLHPPSFGLLHLFGDGRVTGEIIGLKGAKPKNGKWYPQSG